MSQVYNAEAWEEAHARATFQALADAIIPVVARQTEGGTTEFVPGAVQLEVDQFVASDFDHSQFVPEGVEQAPILLSRATAHLLEVGAVRLLRQGLAKNILSPSCFPGGGLFSALSRTDRLQVLAIIDRLDIPLHLLLPPFQNNPALVQTIVDSLHQLTMFGYYSEWFGYGTTRFDPPDDRRLECFPPGWTVAGYPGPSFGYRALRGFVFHHPGDKGEPSRE